MKRSHSSLAHRLMSRERKGEKKEGMGMNKWKLVVMKLFVVCVCAAGILQRLNVSLKKQLWSPTRLVLLWSLWQLWNADISNEMYWQSLQEVQLL